MEDTAWNDDYYDFMNRDLLKICNKSIQIHGLHKKKKFMSFLFPEWTSGDLTFYYTHSEGKIWWVNPGNPDKWYEVSNGNLIKQLNAMTDERGKRDRQEKRDDAAIFKETLKNMRENKPRANQEEIYRALDAGGLQYISLENNFVGYKCGDFEFKTNFIDSKLVWFVKLDGVYDWEEVTNKSSAHILNAFAFYE